MNFGALRGGRLSLGALSVLLVVNTSLRGAGKERSTSLERRGTRSCELV